MPYFITTVTVLPSSKKIKQERVRCETPADVKSYIEWKKVQSYYYIPSASPEAPLMLSYSHLLPGFHLFVSGNESEEEFKQRYYATARSPHIRFIPMKNPNTNLRKVNWRSFFAHPGTWVSIALAAIIICLIIGSWALAPLFVLIATTSIAAAVISLPFYIYRYLTKLKAQAREKDQTLWECIKDKFKNWVKDYPFQVAIAFLGLAAFITTLVLTIGFFTGGIGFAFMAPLFTMIALPFAVSATVTTLAPVIGVSYLAAVSTTLLSPLSLAIISGFVFTLFTLNLTNTIKRLDAWLHPKSSSESEVILPEEQPTYNESSFIYNNRGSKQTLTPVYRSPINSHHRTVDIDLDSHDPSTNKKMSAQEFLGKNNEY